MSLGWLSSENGHQQPEKSELGMVEAADSLEQASLDGGADDAARNSKTLKSRSVLKSNVGLEAPVRWRARGKGVGSLGHVALRRDGNCRHLNKVMSLRRIVSRGDVRVVVQKEIHSGPSSFAQFDRDNATFVDKSLAIEAFLRDRGGHHLVLRPRRCGKSHTLSMIRLSLFLIKYLHLLM